MSEPRNNALPWRVNGYLVFDSNNAHVAELFSPYESNGRLIVTAVNAHTELLAVAKLIARTAPDNDCIDVLRAAIAKAEEIAP